MPISDVTETLKTSHFLLPYKLSIKNKIHFDSVFFYSDSKLTDTFLVSLAFFEGSPPHFRAPALKFVLADIWIGFAKK